MKYQWMREQNFVLSAVAGMALIFGLYVAITRWQEGPSGVNTLVVLMLLFNAAVLFYLLYSALRSAAYANILDDGIHVISRKDGEITMFPWEKVKDCRLFSAHVQARRFILLPLRWDATFCGKPLSTYRGSPPPRYRDVTPYLLDDLMEKLVRGQMSPEKFQGLPLLLLATGPSNDGSFERCRALWRAKVRQQRTEDAEDPEV